VRVDGLTLRAAMTSSQCSSHCPTDGTFPASPAVPASRLASSSRTFATTSLRVRPETCRRSRRPFPSDLSRRSRASGRPGPGRSRTHPRPHGRCQNGTALPRLTRRLAPVQGRPRRTILRVMGRAQLCLSRGRESPAAPSCRCRRRPRDHLQLPPSWTSGPPSRGSRGLWLARSSGGLWLAARPPVGRSRQRAGGIAVRGGGRPPRPAGRSRRRPRARVVGAVAPEGRPRRPPAASARPWPPGAPAAEGWAPGLPA
jgi:hypothetical protein